MAALSIMLTALAVLGPMINAERKVIRSECDTTNSNDNATIFNFSEKALLGDSVINLSDYRGKVRPMSLVYFYSVERLARSLCSSSRLILSIFASNEKTRNLNEDS